MLKTALMPHRLLHRNVHRPVCAYNCVNAYRLAAPTVADDASAKENLAFYAKINRELHEALSDTSEASE